MMKLEKQCFFFLFRKIFTKNRRRVGGGPLDGAMLDMVGEKVKICLMLMIMRMVIMILVMVMMMTPLKLSY